MKLADIGATVQFIDDERVWLVERIYDDGTRTQDIQESFHSTR